MNHSILDIATCIKKLRLGFPVEYLANFLSDLVLNFSWKIDLRHSRFDGEEFHVVEGRGPTLLELAKLMRRLVQYHPPSSPIASSYGKALTYLTNAFYLDEKTYQSFLRTRVDTSQEDPRNLWQISLIIPEEWKNGEKVGKRLKFLEEIRPLYNDLRIYQIDTPYLETIDEEGEDKPLVILYIISKEGPEKFLLELMEQLKLRSYDTSCITVPFTASLQDLGLKGCTIRLSQGGKETLLLRERLEPSVLDVLFDGPNHYKFYGSLGVGFNRSVWEFARQTIEDVAQNRLRIVGEWNLFRYNMGRDNLPEDFFTDLLFTRNFTLPEFLEMIYGDRRMPTSYRWGVSAVDGEVVVIMKPQFYRKYLGKHVVLNYRGDSPAPQPTGLLQSLNPWRGEAPTPRVSSAPIDNLASQKVLREEVARFLYANKGVSGYQPLKAPVLEMESGVRVGVEDIQAILVPNFWRESSLLLKLGSEPKPISYLLQQLEEKIYLPSGFNPVRGRVHYYGDGSFPFSYLIPSHPLYSNYQINDPSLAQQEGLKDPKEGAKMVVTYEAFIRIQELYMKEIAYLGMINNLVGEKFGMTIRPTFTIQDIPQNL